VLSQIGSESGGNAGILQSVHDINSGPNAAVGLLQLTPGTFNSYAGPYRSLGRTNPLANVFAGVNYEMHKYGGNPSLRDFGHGHGYAGGGYPPIGRPFWVGERGPELMVAGTQTRVYSNEESQRMSGDDRTTAMLVDALRKLPAGIGRAVAAELNGQAAGSRLNGRTYSGQFR
jgi:SLT domain-containing protein